MIIRTMAALLLTGTASAAADAQRFERTAEGVIVTPGAGNAGTVELRVHGEGIMHVVATPTGASQRTPAPSLMVADPPAAGRFDVTEAKGQVRVRTAKAIAEIGRATGLVRFTDATGKPLLAESAPTEFGSTQIDGKPSPTVSQQFNRGTEEGLYGLGQHQNAQMDYNGEDVELAQHNMDIGVPFVVSTRGYGLLWDNNSFTRFGNPKPYAFVGEGMTVTSGGKPGWRAEYFLDGKPAVTRQEATIDYQYINDQAKWPEAAKARTVAATGGQNTAGNAVQKQTVVWSGDVMPGVTGVHKFQLYGSSYYKVYADGKLVLERWRQNWNPWYANFDLPMVGGKPVAIRIEWEPNAGYMAFFHSDPLPDADRHSVWFTSDVAQAKDYWFIPAAASMPRSRAIGRSPASRR